MSDNPVLSDMTRLRQLKRLFRAVLLMPTLRLSSHKSEDQELSMLSLHLLQNCMVFVNTLMLQQVLARPHSAGRLNARDLHALTPLIWEKL
jgi:TnpA family transposase